MAAELAPILTALADPTRRRFVLLRSEGSDYQVQLRGGVKLRVGRSRREALERRLGRTW